MSQLIEVKVPDIGDFSDVPVIELFVKVGDTIKVDDAIATLESDKATMDVPSSAAGPVIAATDYIKLFAEQIRPFVKNRYVTLGTDGFGRSDTREKLRHFFEVDRRWVTLAALKALADEGKIEREKVAAALVKYNLDPAKPNPMSV